MKSLSFTNRTKIRPVIIQADDGKETHYELREMTAAVRDKYMDRMTRRLITTAKGDVIGIKSFDGMQGDLLKDCLYDEKGALVTPEAIKEWPSGTVQGLFHAAQELNHLRKPQDRNRIAAEQILKFMESQREGHGLDAPCAIPFVEDLERVLDQTDKNLFKEEEDGESDQA